MKFAAVVRAFAAKLVQRQLAFAARLPADKVPAGGRTAAIRAFAARLLHADVPVVHLS